MKKFQDCNNKVQIQDGEGNTFSCSSDEFADLESSYTPLATPYIVRRWTETVQYLITKGNAQQEDPLYTEALFMSYVENIATYTAEYNAANPEEEEETSSILYLAVELSGGDGKDPPGINLNETDAEKRSITFDCTLQTSEGTTVAYDWDGRISIFDLNEQEIEMIAASLTGGVGEVVFTPDEQSPRVTHQLLNKSFDTITINEVTYAIHLTDAVKFKVYRGTK